MDYLSFTLKMENLKNYLFKIIWSFMSVALLFCFAILFVRGQWAF